MGRFPFREIFNRVVIVSALGYFVDIYDLILFLIVRTPSLNGIGITDPERVEEVGFQLLNWQMGGMLLGGILWGVLGDKRGRRSILFGSIALYSLANLANAFVNTVEQYAALRFFAGVGLAGELGAAVTLVSEVLPKHLRGYGTMIVSAVGILGASAGWWVASRQFPGAALDSWRIAYLVGGGMGILLLIARVAISESVMFKAIDARTTSRGNLLMLVNNWNRARRFLLSTLIGLPLWCTIGILIAFSPEISRDLGVTGKVEARYAVLFSYLAISVGSLASGSLSQILRSRKNAVITFVTLTAIFNFVYFFGRGVTPATFYWICAGLGFAAGYWAVFIQIGAEQFGTNLRATVATTIPNLIRGSVPPLTFLYQYVLLAWFDRAASAMLLLSFCCLVSLFCVRLLPETYGKDLNYLEGAEPTRAEAPTATPVPIPVAAGGSR